MFLNFYKLPEQLFGVRTNPHFLCLRQLHREALACVLYGITASRGFTALSTGPHILQGSTGKQVVSQ